MPEVTIQASLAYSFVTLPSTLVESKKTDRSATGSAFGP